MGMKLGNEDEKTQLASEICDVSARAIACAKFHNPHTKKSPFINWYLVLRVNENADTDVIRKQYHKLALLLHPDKNKHSKAETAFKLVSEAYSCLSDNARRAVFDSQRKNITSCISCKIHPNFIPTESRDIPSKKVYRIQKTRIKELRTKLKEEAMIINKCLVANSAAASTRTRTESPVFDPSDYKQNKGYPHNRTVMNPRTLEDLKAHFRTGNICSSMFNMAAKNRGTSPVFQCRSENKPFMSRSATTRGEH